MTKDWLFLHLLAVFFTSVASTVTLPEYNKSYASFPALFGKRLPLDNPVSAYLQVIDDWPLLCNNSDRIPDQDAVVKPDDGLPVALLVERGNCTFWEKGETALLWSPPVKYVIVYDNEAKLELVPMSSEVESEMTLLFVTRRTGFGKPRRSVTLETMGHLEFLC